MRFWLLIGLCFFLYGCSEGGQSRNYVITQSRETAAETEVTAEPPAD